MAARWPSLTANQILEPEACEEEGEREREWRNGRHLGAFIDFLPVDQGMLHPGFGT